MKNTILKGTFAIAFGLAAQGSALSGNYIQQAAFNAQLSSVAGVDTDSLGNLYVLGITPGAVSYQVTAYQMPGFVPQFSFNTGVVAPGAFAVESSGVIDVIETSGALMLKRFNNVGQVVAFSTYTITSSGTNQYLSAAIDKVNDRVFIGYQYTQTVLSPGCPVDRPIGVIFICPNINETWGVVNEYDFNANELVTMPLPGNSYSGGVYTPTALGVDLSGNVYVADGVAKQVLPFSSNGVVKTAFAISGVPKGIWSDPSSNLYVNEPVCGPTSCPYGIAKMNASGTVQTSFVDTTSAGTAADSRMIYSASSSTVTRWIYDDPPTAPVETSPLGMTVQHSTAATLAWQASTEPDGDAISYSVYLGTAALSLSLLGSTSQTQLQTGALSFGATYYWQVVAQDAYDGVPVEQSSAPVVFFNWNLLDSPPGAFDVVSGTGTVVTRATTDQLSWQPSADIYGDPITYNVFWSTSASLGQPVASSTSTAWLATGLSYGTTYYWTIQAADPYGETTLMSGGTVQMYLPVFLNSPPSAPVLASPSATVNTMRNAATVSWQQVSDSQGDPITYTVKLGNSAANMQPIATISQSSGTVTSQPAPFSPASQVQSNGNTIQLCVPNLNYYETYYVQVVAANPYGATAATQAQSFTLTPLGGFPKAYNYPNPFSPNRGGTNIVFNAPPSGYAGATVEVYSEWQDLLFKQEYPNIPPGISQVHFDGRDRYGRAFYNGSYIVRVTFSGPSDSAIFYLLVVK